MRTTLARSRERVDAYTLELQRHGLDSVEREVRWLTELIDSERRVDADDTTSSTSTGTDNTTSTDGTPSGVDNRE